MSSHYYKKAKKDQIEIFCTVVECSNNMTLAKDIVGLSVSSISAKISSLAADLGFELFDNKINSLYLTAKGKDYYEEMKNKPRIFLKSNDITPKIIIKNNIFTKLSKNLNKKIKMIKYGKYYYTVFGTNGYEGHHTHETPVERYLVWGKFTLSQLMKHDNGSYWRLITKYGIKID